MRRLVSVLVAAVVVAGCSESPPPAQAPVAETPTSAPTPAPQPVPAAAPWELPSDPAQIADGLVADERTLHGPAAPEPTMTSAAQRQQAAYRTLGRHPEWDPIVRPRIPQDLVAAYDLNIDARRHLDVLNGASVGETLPEWRIVAPAPADELLGYYRAAEAATGVGWNYLAAINFIETRFGRITGPSTAGAQGPMQFLPSTFAAYGEGGDILSPRDSIMAAGRMLAANGFAADSDRAVFSYNNSDDYVRAVHDYAAVLAADPAAVNGYHRWDVYFATTTGDVILPVEYPDAAAIPVPSPVPAPPAEVEFPGDSAQILARMLAAASMGSADISAEFLGTPYGANTLIGSQDIAEQLVVDLEKVDCFTFADYVEALKLSKDREQFVAALTDVRYRDGVVSFATRKHFFTDWAAVTPAVATDVTASLSPNAVQAGKTLNQKDTGGQYLPGLPIVPRTVSYIPSDRVDGGVLSGLRTGDYIGSYAPDGGLDVTHVGIFIAGAGGPVVRNASSLNQNQKVVDSPFAEYVAMVPGIVVLRPNQ